MQGSFASEGSIVSGYFPVVIHHNPECGTSRNVVEIVVAAGYQPTIIEYLKTGWTRPQLLALFAAAGVTARQALRTSKTPAIEMGLAEAGVQDDQIIAAMLSHPILVNRPLVATPKGVRLCRPSETVLDLLDRWPRGPFYKEDGELIIDEHGKRTA
jgi:arsenate reductase